MPAKVIDASALAALLFREDECEGVAERVRGATLYAPVLISFELASVCLKKRSRYPKQRKAMLAAMALVERMEIKQVMVPFQEIVTLAEKTRMTAYDAAYLWLAQNLKAELVTLDNKLSRVAKRFVR